MRLPYNTPVFVQTCCESLDNASDMEYLKIHATKDTPEISFNENSHILTITGDSYPENCAGFYEPLMEKLKTYLEKEGDTPFRVHIHLIYFNSSTAKVLMDIIEMLEEKAQKKPIRLHWFYDEDNENSLMFGQEFKSDCQRVDFHLIKNS